MSQATRLREIVAILETRRHPVPVQVFLDELGISLATFKRDLDVLRDQMQAPIVWRRGSGAQERGYLLQDAGWSSGKLGLPRAWFTAREIYSLLTIDTLARQIGPGLLSQHLQPLITRVTLALSAADDAPEDIRSRVTILASATKRPQTPHFEALAEATVRQQRLRILYFTRSRDEHAERVISPQRLVHYRENWYVVAWCHKAEALLYFALDAIEATYRLDERAKQIAKQEVDNVIGRDFGIFVGRNRQWAKLLISPRQARWVEAEIWHPEQKMVHLEDGTLILELPYGDPRELIQEILRLGPDITVLGPPELRTEIIERLDHARARYNDQ